jgi:hypothetical protein
MAGGVADAPFDAFDDDEITERIAVECVEKEQASRFDDAGGFGDQQLRFFYMFEDIHSTRNLEGGVRIGKGIGISAPIIDCMGIVVLTSDLKAPFGEIDGRDAMSFEG